MLDVSGFYCVGILFFTSLTTSNAQVICSHAPTEAIRIICKQITDWAEISKNARTRTKYPVASPGSTGLFAETSFISAVAPSSTTTAYECMDIACLCRFFGGTGGSSNCVLENGQTLGKAIRKEYRVLTDDERQRYHRAMWTIKNNGEYDRLSQIHSQYMTSPGAHSGPAFLPWHRELIKRLEIALRRVDPTVALPYWDSTLDERLPDARDSSLWSNELMGKQSTDGSVRNGAFRNWSTLDDRRIFRRSVGTFGNLMTDRDISSVIATRDVQQVLAFTAPQRGCPYPANWTALEYIHGAPHVYTGGDMLVTLTATHDPLFFNHHSMIDYIWEMWRVTQQSRSERETMYPRNNALCSSSAHFFNTIMAPFSPMMNLDGLSNQYTDNLYQFDPRPTCSYTDPSRCGSKYLFCDLSHGSPHCASKIVVGGRCGGFRNNEDRCYLGRCVNNFCVMNTVPIPTTTQPPASSTTQRPAPTTTQRPAPTTTQRPAPTTTQRPATTTTQRPAPTTTQPPASTTTRRPAPTTTQRPSPITTQRPATTTTQRPAPTTTQPPASTTTQRPAPTTTQPPASTTTQRPAPTTTQRPAPTTTQRPAPTTTQRPAPTTTQPPAPTTTRPASTTTHPPISTTTPVVPVQETCFNEQQCCASWAEGGECRRNPDYMNLWCKASCGVCTPTTYDLKTECLNRHSRCVTRMNRGECRRNRAWMAENCREACGACGLTRLQACINGAMPPSTTTTTTTSTTTTTMAIPASSDTDCLNQHYCCIVWASRGYCDSRNLRSYMVEYCQPSCGVCTGISATTRWNTRDCNNFHPNCNTWAAQGYCSTNRAYMWENCRQSCGACRIGTLSNRLSSCGFPGRWNFPREPVSEFFIEPTSSSFLRQMSTAKQLLLLNSSSTP